MMMMMIVMMKKGLFAHHTVYVEACTLGCEKATLTYFRVIWTRRGGVSYATKKQWWVGGVSVR